MNIKEQYKTNKDSKVGESCKCPSCNTNFIKKYYQQAFCQTKGGTICKDFYWNLVTPTKRNNKTRISPASRRYMNSQYIKRESFFDPHDDEHIFSSEALGQD